MDLAEAKMPGLSPVAASNAGVDDYNDDDQVIMAQSVGVTDRVEEPQDNARDTSYNLLQSNKHRYTKSDMNTRRSAPSQSTL